MTLRIVPMTFATACEFIDAEHRHHRAPTGHKFSIGVADDHTLFDPGPGITTEPQPKLSADAARTARNLYEPADPT